MKNEILLTVSEVARILLTSTQTVRNYIKNRLLKAKQKGPRNSFLIKEKHLDKFIAKGYAPLIKEEKKKKEVEKASPKKKPKVRETIKGKFYTPLSK